MNGTNVTLHAVPHAASVRLPGPTLQQNHWPKHAAITQHSGHTFPLAPTNI